MKNLSQIEYQLWFKIKWNAVKLGAEELFMVKKGLDFTFYMAQKFDKILKSKSVC